MQHSSAASRTTRDGTSRRSRAAWSSPRRRAVVGGWRIPCGETYWPRMHSSSGRQQCEFRSRPSTKPTRTINR